MAWTSSGLGTIAGITGVIAGITGPAADAAQIAAVKTLLVSEIGGICTTTYNGAKLVASGEALDGLRTIQIQIIPLDLDL